MLNSRYTLTLNIAPIDHNFLSANSALVLAVFREQLGQNQVRERLVTLAPLGVGLLPHGRRRADM